MSNSFFVTSKNADGNRNYSDDYLSNLYGDISWNLDNIFKDKETEIKGSGVDGLTASEVNGMVTAGHTKETADDDTRIGAWYKPESKNTKIHTFNKLYKKLMCCLNKNELNIPYIADYVGGKPVYKELKITMDVNTQTCNFDDTNWWDDNTTKPANPHCLKLFKKLIVFLKLYDPNNPMIKKYGGCIDDGLLPSGNPNLIAMVNSNRKCGPLSGVCNIDTAFKRDNERETCNLTFCDQSLSFDDISAGGNSVFKDISQTCGPDTKVGGAINNYNTENDRQDGQNMTDNIVDTARDDPIVKEKQEEVAKLREEAKTAIEEANKPEATNAEKEAADKLKSDLAKKENELRLAAIQAAKVAADAEKSSIDLFLEDPFNLENDTTLYIYGGIIVLLLLSSSSSIVLASR